MFSTADTAQLCSVLQTLHSMYSTADTAQYVQYCRHCTVCTVLQTLHSMFSTTDTAQYVQYCRHCTVCTVLQTLHSMYSTADTAQNIETLKKGNYFSPFHNVQNISRIDTAVYQIGTVRSLLRGKQPAWNWSLTSIKWQEYRNNGAVPLCPIHAFVNHCCINGIARC